METQTELYKRIIENYIRAYNAFDVESMLADMSPGVRFENISNGVVNLVTSGVEELRKQALAAAELFTEREQTVTGFQLDGNAAEVTLNYAATLAIDLPNGLKSGQKIEMKGRSIFRFRDDKIIVLQDIS